ncbi:MAG: SUF system NifU family Fe-S cluster assembly protein [Clostridiales bacterium]|nr:SUF system NifU family Fe-S cluster assembly protein [Clostridiales bacterium]
MDLRELYSEMIMEHSGATHNRRHIPDPTLTLPGRNPSCGDEIELELELRDGRIQDAAFTGEGCAISQASVSMMLDLVRGKTVQEGLELSRLFLAMSRRETLTQVQLERLEDAAVLQNVSNMPARVKCATMPWHTLVQALESVSDSKPDV